MLQDYPRLREKLKSIRCRSGGISGWIFAGCGLLLIPAAMSLRSAFPAAAGIILIVGLLCLGAAVFLLWRHYAAVMKAGDTWLKASDAQLEEAERTAGVTEVHSGCLLYEDFLIAAAPVGNVFLNYEDILWVWGLKQASRFGDIRVSAENSVFCIDIEGNEYRLMSEKAEAGSDPDAMAAVLLDKMHKAGYYPLCGYDDRLRKETGKDLDVLKRRYEQSMSEQFEKEAGKWICPHCTAENENTDRCIYCGCRREIKIPDAPVQEAPVQEAPQPEKDYSHLAPNPGRTSSRRSSPMLTVFLALACVAVMAVSLVIANMMGRGSNTAAQPADTPSEVIEDVQENDNRVLDGYVGDTISTAFFDFTVNEARTADSYGSLTPAEGNTFCIVNVTVHNTMRQSLPMFDTDFVLFWGPGDSDGSFPVTHDDPSRRTDKMLEESYYIGINETVTGDLVYELPKTHDPEGILYFEEYFENGEYGDYYTVTFPLN